MKIVGVSVFSSVLVKLEYGVIGYNYAYERERCGYIETKYRDECL